MVAAVQEKSIHNALSGGQGDDGRWGQDEDGGHDHQHPGQGHLTCCDGVLFERDVRLQDYKNIYLPVKK